ncbi:protein of unknown function [Cupriavidus taiwanensis]|uniref:Uncharacterized protein n=1 Tax=Cupriavidus taiwanensis TaxID=164546 RepID=A0A375IG77_9BURK|nr:protein of unknown function [Cupriavidus taiwanensis]
MHGAGRREIECTDSWSVHGVTPRILESVMKQRESHSPLQRCAALLLGMRDGSEGGG